MGTAGRGELEKSSGWGWEWVLGFSISFFLPVSCLSHPNPEERVPIWPIRQTVTQDRV